MSKSIKDNYVSRAQLAKLLGVAPSTVKAWDESGRIKPALRLPSGRYLYDYDAIIASMQVTPESPTGKDADAE